MNEPSTRKRVNIEIPQTPWNVVRNELVMMKCLKAYIQMRSDLQKGEKIFGCTTWNRKNRNKIPQENKKKIG